MLERAIEALQALYELPLPESVSSFVAAGHQCLGEALGSGGGYVVLAVRVFPAKSDPLRGFRPVYNYSVGERIVEVTQLTAKLLSNDHPLVNDPIIRRTIEDAGRHRTQHDPDPRLSPATQNTIDAQYWNLRGLVDRIKLMHAIDERSELHVGFDRTAGQRPFGPAEEALIQFMVAGLGPWARRIALLHGEGPGMTPLAPRERDALCLLLGELRQKQYAQALGLSDGRARELVRLVYRKLGINGRSELTMQWSARRRDQHAMPPVKGTGRAGRGREHSRKK